VIIMYAKRPFLFLIPLLVGVSHPALALRSDAETTAPNKNAMVVPAGYRIETDDVLEITVLGEPELSRSLTVLPDGQVSYPYLGQIRVEGLTVMSLTEQIRKALTAQIRHPEVTISVVKRADHTVSVLGAVKTPGRSVIHSGWRVLDVLAAAGGLAVERPEWATATLVSGGKPTQIDLTGLFAAGNPASNPPVTPGDILLVTERDASQTQVQVLGAVVKQGTYPSPEDGSLVSAVALAGGAAPDAALSRAIIRRSGRTIPVDLRPVLTDRGTSHSIPAPSARLEPGDTLFIPQNTRHFAVLGAVSHPGALAYPEEGSLGVLEALSLAGGQSQTADLKNVLLMRADVMEKEGKGTTGKAIPLNLWDEMRRRREGKPIPSGTTSVADIQLAPGDVLFVPDKGANRRSDLLTTLPLFGWLLR
jgi:polysaccharide export outer membrane protein